MKTVSQIKGLLPKNEQLGAKDYFNKIKLIHELKKEITTAQKIENGFKFSTNFGSYEIGINENWDLYSYITVLLGIESKKESTAYINTIFVEQEFANIATQCKKLKSDPLRKFTTNLHLVFLDKNLTVYFTDGNVMYRSQKMLFTADVIPENRVISISKNDLKNVAFGKNDFIELNFLTDNLIEINGTKCEATNNQKDIFSTFNFGTGSEKMNFDKMELTKKVKILQKTTDYKGLINVHLNGSIHLQTQTASDAMPYNSKDFDDKFFDFRAQNMINALSFFKSKNLDFKPVNDVMGMITDGTSEVVIMTK